MNYFTKRAFALISAIAILLMLGGCPSTAVLQQEMNSQRTAELSKIKQSEANAEIERHKTARAFTSPEAQLAYTISEGIAAALRASNGKSSELPPMPVIEGWDDKLLRGLSILAPVAGNVALGIVQSQGAVKIAKYTTDANRAIAESRDKAETDRLIAAGKANVDIAGKIQAPPGTNIHIGGDGVVGDGVINKTNNCYATSGIGGNGGNSAPGGAGGNVTTAGNAGTGGNNTAGAGAQSGAAPCTIAK